MNGLSLGWIDTDDIVLQSIDHIVNNPALSQESQYRMLDALRTRVGNEHPDGMAAKILEVIDNEIVVLQFPGREWHGRFGEFRSMRRRPDEKGGEPDQ